MLFPNDGTPMDDFLRYLDQELPSINGYIEGQIARLDPLVAPAAGHVLLAGGKRFRPLLTILCAKALAGDTTPDVYPLACSLEFLHSATLLHDDILDGAALRRGRAAAHIVFTRTETVLAGDILLALANRLVADYGLPRLTACLAEALMRTAAGEVAEIVNLRQQDLSVQRYFDIITGKTAFLIEAACRSGAILAGTGPEVEQAAAEFGLHLGIAFQVVDDAMDYTSPSHVSGKPAGGDLREGKLTLPLLYLLEQRDPAARQDLLARIRAKSLAEAEIQALLAEIQDQGLPARARQVAADSAAKARKALEGFPSRLETDILSQTLDFVLTREK